MQDGQTLGTHKNFAYYKHSLIEEHNLFWLDHGERVSVEVASVFENTEMYGQVVNVPLPSASILTFILKWDMTRDSDGTPLQEYPTTVNITPSNANKFLL